MNAVLVLIQEAREEYHARLADLVPLTGVAFEEAARELSTWADDINASLSEASLELLDDSLAVDTESLERLRLERSEG